MSVIGLALLISLVYFVCDAVLALVQSAFS